ncbi:MAG: hypothetical protein K6L81_02465 [Agarilytica sp.]
MTYLILCSIAITTLGIWGNTRGKWDNFFTEAVCPVASLAGFAMLVFCGIFGFNYHGSQYKAEIINREFGTSYTQQEVFYADSVIDTIREVQRQRIEVNGDLMKQSESRINSIPVGTH